MKRESMTAPDLRTPAGSPATFINAKTTIVACLGSSSTAGKGQAFDWISELAQRPRNKGTSFLNFGVGGDLAYNALQRLPKMLASHPDKVLVLIGGNDVIALVSNKARRFFRISKHLPKEPSPEWLRENLRAIVRELKTGTPASVGLCSLFLIGQQHVHR
jgi:lysophospholipase L1-like esterase